MTTVMVTGHRPSKIGGYSLPNPIYIKLCQTFEKLLLEIKPDKAISGMAQGADSYFAHVVLKLGIPLIAAVPFIGQEKAWPEKAQKIYHNILSKASEVNIVCEGGYAAYKMTLRNNWMVDRADIIIAVFDKSLGGTQNCLNYAKSVGKTNIIVIDPKTL